MRVPVTPPENDGQPRPGRARDTAGLLRSAAPREPTPKFISDLCTAIRGGTRPAIAAKWASGGTVSAKRFRRWMKRRQEPFTTMQAQVRAALAHAQVRLESEIARRHPEKALARLREQQQRDALREAREREERDARLRVQTGRTAVRAALPYLIERIADPRIPDDALSLVEQAARAWRDEMLRDLGGSEHVSAARRALLDTTTGSLILLHSIDAAVFRLAAERGVVSRKFRRAFPVILDRMRVADSLVRQLETLGLDRVAKPVTDLASYVQAKYGDRNGAPEPAPTEATEPAP